MASGPVIPPSQPAIPAASATSVTPDRGIDKIQKTAEDFEAFFLSQMFEHMTSGMKVDETFGGGNAETIYRSMQNEQFGKALSKSGGVGVAAEVEREMLKMQEANK